MQRLTFKEQNGTFGVVGMNEQNQEQKLYMCVKKLLDYEQTGLSPEEVERLKEQIAQSEAERKKAYKEGFLQKQFEKDAEIMQLKQQLAEKEYSIGMLNQHLTDKAIEIERLGEEIKELKTENMNIFECSQKLEQKLAEKEKEIEKQNRRISLLEKYKNDQKTRAHDYYKRCKQVNQDKISFAVERLKAVKLLLISSWGENDCNLFLGDTEKIIDNQIEKLKGAKKWTKKQGD